MLRWFISLIVGVLLVSTVGGAACAAEPRPWLCRDKPVFSSSGPSRVDLSGHDSRRWQVFLMQFDPSGGHDGFTITNTYDLGSGNRHAGEPLTQGRYFAVALYNSGGHWICAGPARNERTAGTIANICYGAGGGCDVTLIVKAAGQ